MRLLLVEDDSRIARFVAKGLREQAYAVDVSATGEDALYQADINTYDLVILDVMIPGRDGFDVCRELRKSGKRMPILMLTARDAVEDRITGRCCAAPASCARPELSLPISCWIPRRRQSPALAARFLSQQRNTRYSNSSRAMPAVWLAARRSPNTFGMRVLIRFRT